MPVLNTFNELSICIILAPLNKTLSSICIVSKAFGFCLRLIFYVKRAMNKFLHFFFTRAPCLSSFLKMQRLTSFHIFSLIISILRLGKNFSIRKTTGSLSSLYITFINKEKEYNPDKTLTWEWYYMQSL
jgi:hypothetical protein